MQANDTTIAGLAVNDAASLGFGVAPKPVKCGFELTIGGGQVYPEVNFTLPPLKISDETWPAVLTHYRTIASEVLHRALALRVPGIVLEFELLPAMTERPAWGAEITSILREQMEAAWQKSGLHSALRVTPTDIREKGKPPALRGSDPARQLLQSFQLNAAGGAHILSIESIGGKEVHDQALMYGDVRGMVFALAVLAPRDMAWLWDQITAVCRSHVSIVPGGDSACAFANTAMQLAHQRMLPEVLAAVVRAMGAARSLVAFEHGAVGPSKDCAYEGPVLKAITGCPISMEGKSAACAHFSPVGNIAGAMCDLWSNESVQNIRLLAGNAPQVFTEVLAYDCRLMNEAAKRGGAATLRNWMVASDEWLSPQAAVLSPDATIEIAKAIAGASGDYSRTVAAGRAALKIIRGGLSDERLHLNKKECQWLDRIEREFDALPADEWTLLEEMREKYSGLFDPRSYGLPA
jgi:methanol--5-hydroxybenzimidazolylcobamide Co-methyltransferase